LITRTHKCPHKPCLRSDTGVKKHTQTNTHNPYHIAQSLWWARALQHTWAWSPQSWAEGWWCNPHTPETQDTQLKSSEIALSLRVTEVSDNVCAH